jgi:NAD+ synthase (glutamine-hydrolysing)
MQRAEAEGVGLLVFPEMSLTGYTCGDLFHQDVLQQSAREALGELAAASKTVYSGVAVVGFPCVVDGQLFNCAAVLHGGRLLGIVPKSYLPNYKEYYDRRWFSPASSARSKSVLYDRTEVPFGTDLLFHATDVDQCVIGVEICEDLWVPIPPSSIQALSGATVLVGLAASVVTVGKADYRRDLVLCQSARCISAYIQASAGVWESSTDFVFDGQCMIAQNGALIAESLRFQRTDTFLTGEISPARVARDRLALKGCWAESAKLIEPRPFRRVSFSLLPSSVR